MATSKWFERQFNFSISNDEYSAICNRLANTAGKLKQIVDGVPADVLVYQPAGKWSVNEHVGHLSLLESLWQARIEDICMGKPVLTPADLENKATTEACFNNSDITSILGTFNRERNKTLSMLEAVSEEDKTKISLHPRLQQPMRIIDNAYFVAEHDDHHLNQVMIIIKNA